MSTEMESKKVDESLRPYSLVRFTHRGRRRKVESVDIVPTNWLTYDKKKKKCTVKFIEDTRHQEDVTLLHTLVKTLTPPPDGWKPYPIELVGTARTYHEALEKIVRLGQEKEVFTNDEEDDIGEVQDGMVTKIRQQDLLRQSNQLAETLITTSAMEQAVSSPSPQSENDITSVEPDDPVDSLEADYSGDGMKNQEGYFDSNIMNTHSTGQTVETVSQVVEVETFDIKADIGLDILKIVKQNQLLINKRLNVIDETLEVLRENQDKIIMFLKNQKMTDIKDVDVAEIHNLHLPFTSVSEFEDFDKRLDGNQLLYTDVSLLLHKCIGRKCQTITKTLTNMLRCMMTKDTLSNFTASRQSKKKVKKQFVLTNLYKLMAAIISRERREMNLTLDQSELQSALSDVISHSNQWTTKSNNASLEES